MTQKEKDRLQKVVDMFDELENECLKKEAWMSEHNFELERQALEIKRKTYVACKSELIIALSEIKVDEWTNGDMANAKEIIAFLKGNTCVLQHDCRLYGKWLENKIKKYK